MMGSEEMNAIVGDNYRISSLRLGTVVWSALSHPSSTEQKIKMKIIIVYLKKKKNYHYNQKNNFKKFLIIRNIYQKNNYYSKNNNSKLFSKNIQKQ